MSEIFEAEPETTVVTKLNIGGTVTEYDHPLTLTELKAKVNEKGMRKFTVKVGGVEVGTAQFPVRGEVTVIEYNAAKADGDVFDAEAEREPEEPEEPEEHIYKITVGSTTLKESTEPITLAMVKSAANEKNMRKFTAYNSRTNAALVTADFPLSDDVKLVEYNAAKTQ